MKKIWLFLFLCSVLLAGGYSPALAVGTSFPQIASFGAEASEPAAFRVIFRCEDLQQTETTIGGNILVAVINDSGVDVRDLNLRIPEMIASPYGHFPIAIGDLPAGQSKEVMVSFLNTLQDYMHPDLPQAPVWQLEYADLSGQPASVNVLGQSSH